MVVEPYLSSIITAMVKLCFLEISVQTFVKKMGKVIWQNVFTSLETARTALSKLGMALLLTANIA